jgi:hypothetical protein
MNTIVNVICYKSKKLQNDEHPLMLRICKDRKTKYKSLGISINPIYWDFEKNKPKSNCLNRDYILKIIMDKEAEYQKKILELRVEGKEFTSSTLITPKPKVKIKSVKEFYQELIKEFEQANKIGNSRIYYESQRSLEAYTNGKLDIPFSHVDIDFLKR